MRNFIEPEIQRWDKRFRGHFINSLSGFKPVSLIGTWNTQRKANLSVFSNIIHMGADPAMIGMISRPRAAGGHTLANIERSRWFTVNHIHADIAEQAHQCSARYAEDASELEEVGFHLFQDPVIDAPFVTESRIRFGVELHQIIPVDVNQTFIILGFIRSVWVNNSCIGHDGFLDLVAAGSLCSSGLDAYHDVHIGRRFPYAKVEKL